MDLRRHHGVPDIGPAFFELVDRETDFDAFAHAKVMLAELASKEEDKIAEYEIQVDYEGGATHFTAPRWVGPRSPPPTSLPNRVRPYSWVVVGFLPSSSLASSIFWAHLRRSARHSSLRSMPAWQRHRESGMSLWWRSHSTPHTDQPRSDSFGRWMPRRRSMG